MKELEGKPGATPALPMTQVKPGPKHASLEGTPGLHPGAGSDSAPVKVFVFSDFQCPVCKRVVEPMKSIARTMPDDVQIIFVHNALEMHPNAEKAALAGVAAFRQGKFWELHDKLFQNQRALHEQDLLLYAEELGLDMKKYAADVADPAALEQVRYERALAAALGVRGTPGFFVNGQKMVGWGSFSGFEMMVKRALTKARSVAAGTPPEQVAIEATKAQGEDGKKFAELVWGAK
jgi:protein-disulfide isomerase